MDSEPRRYTCAAILICSGVSYTLQTKHSEISRFEEGEYKLESIMILNQKTMNPSIFASLQQPSALIITYNPSAGFEDHIEKLFLEFRQIILIDNGSSPEFQQMLKTQADSWGEALKLLLNPYNLGVATALNQGIDWAIHQGYDFIITLDQDSLPMPGMVKEMVSVYNTCLQPDKIAIIAPKVEDPGAGIIAKYLRPKYHFFFERKTCTEEVLEGVSMVITSGSMYNLGIYKKIGPFRDDFFVDYVDTEYCLRARQKGYDIIVACNARLLHRLGNQRKINIGRVEMRPTFHSAIRWYYISRNRIPMAKLYGYAFPHWLLYEIVINSYGLVRMLIFEDHKINKLLAVLLGCIDGFLGRLGAIPASHKTLLSKVD